MEIILKELQDRLSMLETKVTRQEKLIRKIKKDMIPESERKVRQPSGFAKPTYLSPGLCTFLGLAEKEQLPRTEVTKRVLAYVKEQGLQNQEEKRVINMDAKLAELLKPGPDEKVTYFTIQRLLKVHYVDPNAPAKVTEPAKVITPVATAVEPVVVTKQAKKETVKKTKPASAKKTKV